MSKPRVIKWLFVLVSIWAILSSCNPNTPTTIDGFEAVEIKEGKHFSSNGNRGVAPKEPIYMWRFQQSSAYIHHPDRTPLFQGDQKDWNKLIGLSYNLFSNHINSVMVGWRWNPDTELMQLNTYAHVNEARQIGSVMIEVELEQNFQTSIKKISPQLVMVSLVSEADPKRGFEANESTFIVEFQGQNIPITTRKIATYFGGNLPAPHDILIYRKQLN